MAFGSGVLTAAVSYELVLEAFESSVQFAGFGFAAGAVAFYVGAILIDRRGGHGRKSMAGQHQLEGVASAIVFGTVLDGIPESVVLGASLQQGGAVPVAVAIGVSLSNIPESLSATTGLAAAGWARRRILALWRMVVAASVAAALAGWLLLDVMARAEERSRSRSPGRTPRHALGHAHAGGPRARWPRGGTPDRPRVRARVRALLIRAEEEDT